MLEPGLFEPIQSYASDLREGTRIALDLQRHMDHMITWGIALALALVAGLVNLNLAFRNCSPPFDIVVGAIPLVLTLLLGVASRLSLYELMGADSLYAFAKIHSLESLRLRNLKAEQLLRLVLGIMKDEDEEEQLMPLKEKRDRWQKLTARLYSATYLGFAMSVVWILGMFSCRLWQC